MHIQKKFNKIFPVYTDRCLFQTVLGTTGVNYEKSFIYKDISSTKIYIDYLPLWFKSKNK